MSKQLLPFNHSVLLLSTLVLFSSCVSFQYTSLTSPLQTDPENHTFFNEKNGVRAEFSFSGKQMPVRSKVYNHSSEGIYLDLASSVFIYNAKVIGSMKGKESARVRMYSEERELFDQEYTKSTGSISYQKKPDFIYIPPGAYIQMKPQIFKPGYDKTGKERAHMEEVANEQGLAFRYKTYKPEKGNQYEVVLVFSDSKSFDQPWNMHSRFKEEKYHYTTSKSNHLQNMPRIFYTENTSGGGAVGAFLLVGIIGVGISAAASEEPQD